MSTMDLSCGEVSGTRNTKENKQLTIWQPSRGKPKFIFIGQLKQNIKTQKSTSGRIKYTRNQNGRPIKGCWATNDDDNLPAITLKAIDYIYLNTARFKYWQIYS